MTLREINNRQSLIRKYNQTTPKINRVELIATRKIIAYILIYLIQWTPVMIYIAGKTVNYDKIWINAIAFATINFGGIGNMITYIINEKWRDDYKSKIAGISSLFSPKFKFTCNQTSQSQITIEEVVIVEVKQNPIPIPPLDSVVGV
ncbi:4847_t:CDS:2, partial [Cetraspora pellucida]